MEFSAAISPPNSGSGSIPVHNCTKSEGSFSQPSQSLIDEDYDEEPAVPNLSTAAVTSRPPDPIDSQTLASWPETSSSQQPQLPRTSLSTTSQDSALVDSLNMPSVSVGAVPPAPLPLPPPDPQYALYLDRIRELSTPLASLMPPDMAHLKFSDVFPEIPLDVSGKDVDVDEDGPEEELERHDTDADSAAVSGDRAPRRPQRVRPVLCWTRLMSDPPYKPEYWARPTDEPISTLSSASVHIPAPPAAAASELIPDSRLGASVATDPDEFGPLDQFKHPVNMGRTALPPEVYGSPFRSLLFAVFSI